MIVYDLLCRDGGHRFEGWFGSSEDFARQQAKGLLCCPQCGSADVLKAPMAPAVARKGNQLPVTGPASRAGEGVPAAPPACASAPGAPRPVRKGKLPPEAARMMRALATMQSEALRQSRWVGESFVEDARAMHYGERAAEAIHGEATLDQARELLEEGVDIAPLPFPVAPPGKAN